MKGYLPRSNMVIHHILVLFLVGCLPQLMAIDLHQEYYSDVIISCQPNDTLPLSVYTSGQTITNKAWIIPTGSQLAAKQMNVFKSPHLSANETEDNFFIRIRLIKDSDFGVYFCVLVLNDSSLVVFRHNLNIDGPLYTSLVNSYKQRAITGAISAGAILVTILVCYVIWKFTCSPEVKRKRRLLEDLNKGVNRYSTQAYDNVGLELYTKKA